MKFDIFCTVIDNWGDAGVCWRLARGLCAQVKADGQTTAQVRLWIDAPELLNPWLGERLADESIQVCTWDEYVRWDEVLPAQVIIETFACELPVAYIEQIKAMAIAPKWFNLEYLSAEDWVASHHRLPSPQGGGLNKIFYFPGFTTDTGGLLREPDLLARRDAFVHAHPNYWSQCTGHVTDLLALKITLFGYEHMPLIEWLSALVKGKYAVQIAVTTGKAQRAFDQAWVQLGYKASKDGVYQQGKLSARFISMLNQAQFDQLLWSSDVNAVRGEDSLVRALWAGKPLLWDIYKQDDDAHIKKLQAFCTHWTKDAKGVSASVWNRAQMTWNGLPDQDEQDEQLSWMQFFADIDALKIHAERLCQKQAAQTDLVTQLLSLCGSSNEEAL